MASTMFDQILGGINLGNVNRPVPNAGRHGVNASRTIYNRINKTFDDVNKNLANLITLANKSKPGKNIFNTAKKMLSGPSIRQIEGMQEELSAGIDATTKAVKTTRDDLTDELRAIGDALVTGKYRGKKILAAKMRSAAAAGSGGGGSSLLEGLGLASLAPKKLKSSVAKMASSVAKGAKGVTKFIPGLSTAVGALDLGTAIASGDSKQIASSVGGIALGAIGGVLGGPLGAAAGYFAGDWLGEKIDQLFKDYNVDKIIKKTGHNITNNVREFGYERLTNQEKVKLQKEIEEQLLKEDASKWKDDRARRREAMRRSMSNDYGVVTMPSGERMVVHKNEYEKSWKNNSVGFSGEKKAYADLASLEQHRAVRNINPGNIKGNGYLGQVGVDNAGHSIFATKEAGIAGLTQRLYQYNGDKVQGRISGLKTIREIMYTYAPPSDGNDTEGYIRQISSKLGISPDQQIDFRKNPELIRPFIDQIMQKESHVQRRAYSDAEIQKGIEIGTTQIMEGKEVAAQRYAAYLQANPNGRTGSSNGAYASVQPMDLNFAAPKATGDSVSQSLFANTADAINRGVGYEMGAKNSFAMRRHHKTGQTGQFIDCSGWVTENTLNMMRNAKDANGNRLYSDQAIAMMKQAGAGGSGGIIQHLEKTTGRQSYTASMRDLDESKLTDGMIIGMDTGITGHDKYQGIDHVVQAVRGPDGKMYISQSSGSKGVNLTPIDQWRKAHPNAKLFAQDITQLSNKDAQFDTGSMVADASNSTAGQPDPSFAKQGSAAEQEAMTQAILGEPTPKEGPKPATDSGDKFRQQALDVKNKAIADYEKSKQDILNKFGSNGQYTIDAAEALRKEVFNVESVEELDKRMRLGEFSKMNKQEQEEFLKAKKAYDEKHDTDLDGAIDIMNEWEKKTGKNFHEVDADYGSKYREKNEAWHSLDAEHKQQIVSHMKAADRAENMKDFDKRFAEAQENVKNKGEEWVSTVDGKELTVEQQIAYNTGRYKGKGRWTGSRWTNPRDPLDFDEDEETQETAASDAENNTAKPTVQEQRQMQQQAAKNDSKNANGQQQNNQAANTTFGKYGAQATPRRTAVPSPTVIQQNNNSDGISHTSETYLNDPVVQEFRIDPTRDINAW